MELIWLPTLALVTVLGVRVIGVRVGWWRALLIAWLGLATAGIVLDALTLDQGGERSPTLLVIGLGVLAMIAWTGLFELFSSSRSEPRRRRELNPLHALGQIAARGRRQSEIAMIATRFGLDRYARRGARGLQGPAAGRALREALERAGGVYVKLGQFLSTRPDLLPVEVTHELRLLQQHVEPVPTTLIHAVITQELGDSGSAFTTFNPEPSAAASVAQVHEAVLRDGRHVAVKVQRPDIAGQVQRDLDLLLRLAEKLERRTDWAFDMQLVATVEGFAANVTSELDFEAEAHNLRAMAAAVHQHPRLVVPQPIEHLTRPRVLVMDWVDGVPLTDAAQSLDDAERAELARTLLHCFLDQILVGGTFHADPHPGNLLLQPDGRVALIDCGAIGTLDRRQRGALQAVLIAIAAQDPARFRDALRSMTTTSRSIDETALERALGAVLADHLGSGDALLTSLMELTRHFGLALEPVIGGALRAIATLQSTLEGLAPGFDLLDEAKSYGQSLFNPLWAPIDLRSPRDELEALLPTLLPTLVALPRRLDRILGAVERNEMSIGVHLFPSDGDRRFVNQLMAQVIVLVVPTSFGIIGALLILAAGVRLDTETGQILQAVGIGCVGFALLVLLSVLVAALRTRRQRL